MSRSRNRMPKGATQEYRLAVEARRARTAAQHRAKAEADTLHWTTEGDFSHLRCNPTIAFRT